MNRLEQLNNKIKRLEADLAKTRREKQDLEKRERYSKLLLAGAAVEKAGMLEASPDEIEKKLKEGDR